MLSVTDIRQAFYHQISFFIFTGFKNASFYRKLPPVFKLFHITKYAFLGENAY